MFVKVKQGRLKDLPLRHQTLLKERRRYYADDVGEGIVIPFETGDAATKIFIANSDLERVNETKPHRSVKEYRYSVSHRKKH